MCVCALSESRGSLSQDSKKASTSQISIRSFGRCGSGISILASGFVSLFETAPEPRKMGTHFSQAGLFPAWLKGLPPHHHHSLTWPPPSLLLAREECVALPGMLAAAPPLGSEIRTIWWGEGRQDSAGGGGGGSRERRLSSVTAPCWPKYQAQAGGSGR